MEKTNNVWRSMLKYLAIVLVIVGSVLVLINTTVFILRVPSSSMEPTLNINEEFLAKRVSDKDEITYGIYGFYSAEEDMMMVKRIVGLPGDELEFVDGDMYRNNEPVDEDYILYDAYFTAKFEVPEDSYLMLGDNRADSFDARYWAQPYIPREDIVGKVIFRVRPFFRIGFVK